MSSVFRSISPYRRSRITTIRLLPALLLIGCAQPPSRSESLADIAGISSGVAVFTHALSCQMDGWALDRIEAIRARGVPTRFVFVAPDSSSARQAADNMDVTTHFARIDNVAYESLANQMRVATPFFVVLKRGRPQAILGNMESSAAVRLLQHHLSNINIPNKTETQQ